MCIFTTLITWHFGLIASTQVLNDRLVAQTSTPTQKPVMFFITKFKTNFLIFQNTFCHSGIQECSFITWSYLPHNFKNTNKFWYFNKILTGIHVALIVRPTQKCWIILLFNIFEILNKIEIYQICQNRKFTSITGLKKQDFLSDE